mgnify:CR=1 FL=1
MLPCKTEPRATAKAASRAQSHLARQRAFNVEPTRPTRISISCESEGSVCCESVVRVSIP